MCNENFSSKKESEDMVNHPSHYTWLKEKCGVEVIDITRHMNFDLGNAVKYILRAGKKCLKRNERQAKVEDLQKAIWYINDEISRFTKNQPDLKVDNTCNCEGECSCNEAEESPVENDKIDFYIGRYGKEFEDSYKLNNKINILKMKNYPEEDLANLKEMKAGLIGVDLDLVNFIERDTSIPYYRRKIKSCYEVTIWGNRSLEGFCPVNMSNAYVTYHTNVADLINLLNRMRQFLMESQDVIEAIQFFMNSVNIVNSKKNENPGIKFKTGAWYDENGNAKFPGYSANTIFKVVEVNEILHRKTAALDVVVNSVEFESIDTTPKFSPSVIEVRFNFNDNSFMIFSTNSTDINSIVDFIYSLNPNSCLGWEEFGRYFNVSDFAVYE
jgi:hypothetical protein